MTLASLYAGAAACMAQARAATSDADALLWERYSLELRDAAARLTRSEEHTSELQSH